MYSIHADTAPVKVSSCPTHIENEINENVKLLICQFFHSLIFYEISEV